MILVDTSAWIEFLRGTDSPVCDAVDRLLDAELASCDVVSMELLAGKLIDCLIGAVAVRAGAEVLHADADYGVLSRHTEVRVHSDWLR